MRDPWKSLSPSARRLLPLVAVAAVLLGLALMLTPGLARLDPLATRPPAENSSAWSATPARETVSPSGPAPEEALIEELAPLPETLETEAAAARTPETAPATLDCLIEPYQVVSIGSPVTGLIETFHVERGDAVEASQLLVELDSRVEEAAAELARARVALDGELRAREVSLALESRRQDRARKLFESNALSLDLREEIEAEAEIARLRLQQAREDKRLASLELRQALELLGRRTIRSPIAGVVVERLMSVGERVDEDTILRIAQIDPLRVEVILPAAMFGTIRPEMRAAVVPEIGGGQMHVASVTIVDPVVDAASGTFGVRLELPNPDHRITGGLHCQVHFLDE